MSKFTGIYMASLVILSFLVSDHANAEYYSYTVKNEAPFKVSIDWKLTKIGDYFEGKDYAHKKQDVDATKTYKFKYGGGLCADRITVSKYLDSDILAKKVFKFGKACGNNSVTIHYDEKKNKLSITGH